MQNKNSKLLAFAVTTAVSAGAAAAAQAAPATSTHGVMEVNTGTQVAGNHAEHRCGEGKCGGKKKMKDHKCGEGKCGGKMKMKDHKCGEGKCGGKKSKAQEVLDAAMPE